MKRFEFRPPPARSDVFLALSRELRSAMGERDHGIAHCALMHFERVQPQLDSEERHILGLLVSDLRRAEQRWNLDGRRGRLSVLGKQDPDVHGCSLRGGATREGLLSEWARLCRLSRDEPSARAPGDDQSAPVLVREGGPAGHR